MIQKNKKAQGSLEYLLIIGGVLLIAIIVVALILSISNNTEDSAKEANKQVDVIHDSSVLAPIIKDINCKDSGISMSYKKPPTNGITGYQYKLDNSNYKDLTYTDLKFKISKTLNPGEHTIQVVSIKQDKYRSSPTVKLTCEVE